MARAFRVRVDLAVGELLARGVGSRWNLAPPVFRLAWRIGLRVPPPHLMSFWGLFRFFGSWMGLCVPLPLAIWSWYVSGEYPRRFTTLFLLSYPLVFGLIMAIATRRRAVRFGVPLWRDYVPYGCLD